MFVIKSRRFIAELTMDGVVLTDFGEGGVPVTATMVAYKEFVFHEDGGYTIRGERWTGVLCKDGTSSFRGEINIDQNASYSAPS